MTSHGYDLSIEIVYCYCGLGFDSWDKLDAHIDGIPIDQPTPENHSQPTNTTAL